MTQIVPQKNIIADLGTWAAALEFKESTKTWCMRRLIACSTLPHLEEVEDSKSQWDISIVHQKIGGWRGSGTEDATRWRGSAGGVGTNE